jgi:hypothetical protein
MSELVSDEIAGGATEQKRLCLRVLGDNFELKDEVNFPE